MDEQEAQLETGVEQVTTEVSKDPSDQLTPEHPRFKEVVAEKNQLREEIGELKAEMQRLQERVSERQETQDDDSLTREEELALERIDKNLRQRGYVTKNDLEADKEGEKLTSLQGKYNGSDGLPKFVPDEVVIHAKKNGYGRNYEAAYKDMHFDAIVQVAQRRPNLQVPDSEKPTGGERKPATGEFTKEDIAKMSDAEYEANREKILSTVRPR